MHEAERRLRWRAEAMIGSCVGRPAWDVVDDLTVLGYAALAVVGSGLADHDDIEGFLVDVADALVVRGADWLTPAFPDLPDVAQLYSASTVLTPGSRRIRRDPGVKTYLDRLVAELVEQVLGEGTFEAMVEARRQVETAVEALGAGDDAVGAFDDALVAAGLLEREQ